MKSSTLLFAKSKDTCDISLLMRTHAHSQKFNFATNVFIDQQQSMQLPITIWPFLCQHFLVF